MRLPGTVNYPKAEKRAKGQVEALAHITVDYRKKFTFSELRRLIPLFSGPLPAAKKTYVPRPGSKWTAYKKAKACCQFLCDKGAGDENHWYVRNVMLPLIGAIHEEDEYDRLTIDETFECFMLAVSGGSRYGTLGRGPGLFKRQWNLSSSRTTQLSSYVVRPIFNSPVCEVAERQRQSAPRRRLGTTFSDLVEVRRPRRRGRWAAERHLLRARRGWRRDAGRSERQSACRRARSRSRSANRDRQ